MTARIDYESVAPEAVQAMHKVEEYVRASGLERSLLELVRLRASQMNGCAYCVDMHTKDASDQGETEQRLYEVAVWQDAPFFTEREQAALAWTEAVTWVSWQHVPDDIYQAVRRHFSEKELVDLTMSVIAINGWNRLSISFRREAGTYCPGKKQNVAGMKPDIKPATAPDWAEERTTMLIHIQDLFKKYNSSFAYPAFNTQNLEITLGIIQAAEVLDASVIIATSEGTVGYAGLETIAGIVKTMADRSKARIVLHYDHGKDISHLERAIELGYSSVMIDHSHLPFRDNMRDTRQVVEFAHQKGAWVQGEIGRMRGSEDWVSVSEAETLLTDPNDALKFYRTTGVDTLACSVGTVHGIIKMRGIVKPHVDVPRIRAIHELVKAPLVLHGASGVDSRTIALAIQAGIGIINIDTELRLAFAQALRATLETYPEEIDPRRFMKPVIQAVRETAMSKIRQFGTRELPAVA